MKGIDKNFDINMVLMAVFSSLETIKDEKDIELIYEIDATIPKELKGNPEVLSHLLTQILTFVFENSDKKEIVLSLISPKDFLYEEAISFKIEDTNLNKEKLINFLETQLSKNLKLLNGKIIDDNGNTSDIHISIPFKLSELGNKRYYRLPDMGMLGKKVLLICGSQKVAHSIQKMFKYFLYDVTVGLEEYKRRGSDLSEYDILIVEDKLTIEGLEKLVSKVQKETGLKYVILQDSNNTEVGNEEIESAYLIKPVMQESIFELIITLFENEIKDRTIKFRGKKYIIDMEKYIDSSFKKGEVDLTKDDQKYQMDQNSLKKNTSPIEEAENNIVLVVLNREEGEQNAKKRGMVYANELKRFVDAFDHSDIYFRDIVNKRSTWQIKEFCIDLEKQAKSIGAQSISSFADRVSLLFVYDKLDTLPIYTGKYHIELKKLITEIKSYLTTIKR